MKTILSAVLLAFVVLSDAFAADVLQAFPPAEAGMVRHVIILPKQDDESELKVELIIGKRVTTDATNRYFLAMSPLSVELSRPRAIFLYSSIGAERR